MERDIRAARTYLCMKGYVSCKNGLKFIENSENIP